MKFLSLALLLSFSIQGQAFNKIKTPKKNLFKITKREFFNWPYSDWLGGSRRRNNEPTPGNNNNPVPPSTWPSRNDWLGNIVPAKNKENSFKELNTTIHNLDHIETMDHYLKIPFKNDSYIIVEAKENNADILFISKGGSVRNFVTSIRLPMQENSAPSFITSLEYDAERHYLLVIADKKIYPFQLDELFLFDEITNSNYKHIISLDTSYSVYVSINSSGKAKIHVVKDGRFVFKHILKASEGVYHTGIHEVKLNEDKTMALITICDSLTTRRVFHLDLRDPSNFQLTEEDAQTCLPFRPRNN